MKPAPRGLSLVELRRLAVRALAETLQGGKTLDDAILFVSTKNSGRTLAVFDRSWIMEITSGVLRYRGRIDFIIDTYALKKKPSGPLRRYLQTAVYQLLTSDTIEPALVVSETVQAIRENEGEPPSKFANAILRKIAEQRVHWRTWAVTDGTPEAERIAWSSLPEWLYKNLVKQKGIGWTHAFAAACLERPRTWYRKLGDTPGEPGETIELTEGYQGNEPRGYVQDIANQQLVDEVVKLLRKRFPGVELPRILDLCAAPGGKSLGLAAAGYPVTATDYDENRLQKVIENRNRLGFKQIETRPYNEVTMLADLFDVIWIDAPCSSTGILRRHPEVRWNREAEQIKKWVETQGKLVDWARAHLREGGVLIYSTCSVLGVENRGAIEGFEPLQVFERAPQEPPHGDGIYAWIGQKS